MKKTTAIFLSALILLSAVCTAFASNVSNRVYADAVTIEAGEKITVPVRIENNNGFMGFSVIVTYDDDVFTPVSVSKGSMLSGMFNDSIETSTDNSFKVVFTGTGDVVSDGVLFNAVFEVSDSASGKYDIELSYSQPDTFKEGWENVVFSCEDADVTVTVNGTTVPTTEPSTTQKEETTTRPSVTEPSTAEPDTEETTTQPSVTEPSTEPGKDPVGEKRLSIRMIEWLGGLPVPLNLILAVFVYPAAFIVAAFEGVLL